jgi:hypothetical protein
MPDTVVGEAMTMEGASEYTKISKEIGWSKPPIPVGLPSLAEAKELTRRAACGDREAYKTLFAINRFASTPQTDDGLEIIGIIFNAVGEYRFLFE